MLRKQLLFAFMVVAFCFAIFTIYDRDGTKDSRSKTQERVEVRNRSGEVITTLWPRSRDLLILFANTVAREYKLSMHTHQLSDGVAIQLSPRHAEHEEPRVQGIDREVKLTLRNGKMKRTLRMTESELTFSHLAELWGMMGYQVGCSTGGDNWSISRKEYVPPELPDDLGDFLARFTKAVINNEAAILFKFFALTTHFPSNENPEQHDHIADIEAARRFLQDYAADEIVVCSKGYGVEGQETLLLAGRSKTSAMKEWFLYFWIVKRDGDRVITQINRMPNFWLHGYKEKE